jgi:hypothetical protein
MAWIPHSSTYCQTRVDSYCYILSYRALNAATSRGPERVMFIRYGDPLGTLDWGARVSAPDHQERREGQTGGEIHLSTLIIG